MEKVKSEMNITSNTFDSGYESLDGFESLFEKFTKKSLVNNDGKIIILAKRLTTPIGPMFLCATEKGICLLEFDDRKNIKKQFSQLEKLLNGIVFRGENEHIILAKQQLEEYFLGQRKDFELPFFMPGTDFQKQVWKCLTQIPYGETSSYQQQSIMLGNPKAIRAMASANGRNRLAIIVPCHRVIGKDGNLTGYAGGLTRKQWLLEHEKRHK